MLESMAASAAAVTYDFTGTVTYADGVYASIAAGTIVTGTYVFDLANSNSETGTVGSAPNWSITEFSGTSFDLPSSNLLFTSTAQVGNVLLYSTGAIDPTDSTSGLDASNQVTSSLYYHAGEEQGNLQMRPVLASL